MLVACIFNRKVSFSFSMPVIIILLLYSLRRVTLVAEIFSGMFRHVLWQATCFVLVSYLDFSPTWRWKRRVPQKHLLTFTGGRQKCSQPMLWESQIPRLLASSVIVLVHRIPYVQMHSYLLQQGSSSLLHLGPLFTSLRVTKVG
jgi:hypothetical protein